MPKEVTNMTKDLKTNKLHIVIKRSIKNIPEEEWDAIIGQDSLYRSHRFILSIENSNSESADFWYLLFYENEKLVASTVCSCFRVSLDMFMSPLYQKTCDIIRHVFKLFLRPKIIFCGLPISIGKHVISISSDISKHIVIETIRKLQKKKPAARQG